MIVLRTFYLLWLVLFFQRNLPNLMIFSLIGVYNKMFKVLFCYFSFNFANLAQWYLSIFCWGTARITKPSFSNTFKLKYIIVYVQWYIIHEVVLSQFIE